MSLHEPARHEPLGAAAWDAQRARAAIDWIVRDTVARFSTRSWWPVHPDDREPGDDTDLPSTTLYFGAAGVLWALRYLEAVGAVAPTGLAAKADLRALRDANRATLASWGHADDLGSWLMGELPIAMMAAHDDPDGEMAASLPALVEGTQHHPARELMWGAPGALLASSFLHERSSDDARWAERFRRIAAQLRSELRWSDAHGCWYWDQELYGRRSTYLDAVHGFVATAHALIRGRHLFAPGEWTPWHEIITTTVGRTATWEGDQASWRPELVMPESSAKRLMQYCHGAPGFVVCLAGLPHEPALDGLLDAAGRATWAAGPLRKGSNLCHGTAGNGYAFLKLYERSGQARAFAMHAIAQAEAAAARHGQLRYSLWTGDPGLAIYLWDCLRGRAEFPTLDVFYGRN